MKRFFEFAKRLFSLRNLSPLLIIVIAILGSLNLHPFGVTITTDQIIMALLAFLAIDALVERLDLLTNIENSIKSIQNSVSPKMGADAFLRKRKNFPRMEQLIGEARNEIWVVGITLDTMVTLSAYFEEKTKQGCNIRLLALAPNGNAMQEAAKYYATDAQFTSTRIRSNLDVIASRISPFNDGDLEIRVLDRVFTTGYFIIDANTSRGQMIVQSYLYRVDAEQSPLFELSKQDDPQTFSLYMKQYQKMWEEATKL